MSSRRQREREAPRGYDPSRFPRPSVAVDLVVTSVGDDGRLLCLLGRRAEAPYLGAWALPGGFLREDESIPEAAVRVLSEETGLAGVACEEVGTFSEPDRDPRTRVVSVAHLALVPADVLARAAAGLRTTEVGFFALHVDRGGDVRIGAMEGAEAGEGEIALAFDHEEILARAVRVLRARVETTTLAFGLLPARFTLSEAQRVVESILGRTLDRAAFRTKVLSLGLVRPTSEERRGQHRPARLFVAAKGWETAP
ncbi:MAG: NUDIX hydrolase [Polyangiaceae bacterium]|nr:NUDIX hydrolase [Polyangiaceae bacterium]